MPHYEEAAAGPPDRRNEFEFYPICSPCIHQKHRSLAYYDVILFQPVISRLFLKVWIDSPLKIGVDSIPSRLEAVCCVCHSNCYKRHHTASPLLLLLA